MQRQSGMCSFMPLAWSHYAEPSWNNSSAKMKRLLNTKPGKQIVVKASSYSWQVQHPMLCSRAATQGPAAPRIAPAAPAAPARPRSRPRPAARPHFRLRRGEQHLVSPPCASEHITRPQVSWVRGRFAQLPVRGSSPWPVHSSTPRHLLRCTGPLPLRPPAQARH